MSRSSQSFSSWTGKKTIFVVDSQPIIRKGLIDLIDAQPDLAGCGEAENAAEALRKIGDGRVDLAVADIWLDGLDGLQLIRSLAARKPPLPTLVFSAHDERVYAGRALRAGASGYVMKTAETSRIIEAVREVLRGSLCFHDDLLRGLFIERSHGALERVRPVEDAMTERELEVLRLMGLGLSTSETARSLHTSAKTIQRHKDNIRAKLDLDNGSKLQLYAFEWVHKRSII